MSVLLWLIETKIGRGILAALAVIALYFWIDHRGYSRGVAEITAEYEAATVAETLRQAAVNTAAKSREAEQLAVIQALSKSRADLLEQLNNEAQNDDTARECGLSRSGGMRLNRIR